MQIRFWGFLHGSREKLLTRYPRYFDAWGKSSATKKYAHDPAKFAHAFFIYADQHTPRNRAALNEAGGSALILALHDIQAHKPRCCKPFAFACVLAAGVFTQVKAPRAAHAQLTNCPVSKMYRRRELGVSLA